MYTAPITLASVAITLLSGASAIKVLYPDRNTEWASGTSSQMIAWEAVSTDPSSFVVQLVNQAGFMSSSAVTLTQDQATGSPNVQNTAQVSFPNGAWPVGSAFRINLITNSNGNQAILAQSTEFNITSSGSGAARQSASASASSSSSTGVPPATLSQARMTVTTPLANAVSVSGGASASANGDALGGLPNAASSRSASELSAAPSTLFSVIIGAATFFGVYA